MSEDRNKTITASGPGIHYSPSTAKTSARPHPPLSRTPAAHHAPRHSPLRTALRSALIVATSCLLAGCQVIAYRTASGERLTRASFGSTTSISSLAVESSTNGIRRLDLRGYRNDTAQALSAVTEAAVRAAVTSAKP